MKIAKIESIPLRIPYTTGGPSDAAVWGKAGLQTADSLIVSITTDNGIVGWGETFGFTAIPAVKVAIDSIIAPECIGRDATQGDKLSLDLQRKFQVFGRSGAFMVGLSAIDIALWDIAGKAVKQPVCQLLGGSDATSLPAYASLSRYSDPKVVARKYRYHELKIAALKGLVNGYPDAAFMGIPILASLFGSGSLYPILVLNVIASLIMMPLTAMAIEIGSGAKAFLTSVVDAARRPLLWAPAIGIACSLLAIRRLTWQHHYASKRRQIRGLS